MFRGLVDKIGFEECDVVVFLSFINFCDYFMVDRKKVIEVRVVRFKII